MKRQAGNQLYVAGAAVLVLVLIIAGFLWYIGEVRTKAFAAGETAERGRWQARQAEELRMANAAITHATARNAALERQAAQDLVALDEEHLQEVGRVEAAKDRFISDVVAGRIRLHNPGPPAGEATGCPGRSTATAAAGERDGEEGSELPEALRGPVAGGAELAAEADEVVLQLIAAQGVIATYRRTCKHAEQQ